MIQARSTCAALPVFCIVVKFAFHRKMTLMSICLLTALMLLSSTIGESQNTSASSTTDGVWYGVMDAGLRSFRFRIETNSIIGGVTTYRLVSLDEGGQSFALNDFDQTIDSLKFSLKQTKAEYKSKLTDDGKQADGVWIQAGKEFPLIFRYYESMPDQKPAEVFTGTLNVLFQKLEIQLRIYRDADGREDVRFDSISQRAGGFKATRTIEKSEWTIDVPAVAGEFKGVANEDGTEVKGLWSQNGLSFELVLMRQASEISQAVSVPVRPQTPRPPFPYAVENVTIQNQQDGIQLAGTLTLPRCDAACPAVILISGSGPQDRDESLLDHKPFWIIADHLSRNGIAVLRFDDRGTAESTGEFATATSKDFAADVSAALDFLLKDARIDSSQIGLAGHSEGGLIAPMVAASRKEVAFLVLLAGTGVNGKEILLSQGQLILKAEGITDAEVLQQQYAVQNIVIDAVLAMPPDASDAQLLATVMEKLASQDLKQYHEREHLEKALSTQIERIKSPWFRYFLTYEPAESLKMVACPVLAMNGEKDVQVDPRLNLPAIRKALETAGRTDFQIAEIPDVNHLFQTCKTGALSEYQTTEETMSPVVLNKMTAWIHELLKTK